MINENAFRAFSARCLKALAKREYSRAELAAKATGIDDETTQAVLAFLEEKGWQSDPRFGEHFVSSKARRGDGPLKVRQAMRAHGLDDELIGAALGAIDWFDTAKTVYAKKYPGQVDSLAERARRQRFMAQRGFTFAQIETAMRDDKIRE